MYAKSDKVGSHDEVAASTTFCRDQRKVLSAKVGMVWSGQRLRLNGYGGWGAGRLVFIDSYSHIHPHPTPWAKQSAKNEAG